MNEKEFEEFEEFENQSMLTILSYSFIILGTSSAFYMIQAYAFFFYETEVKLPVFFVTLALVIYGLWDAINDPILGYISDKPRKYTKKWGRRFPWIVFGFAPAAIFIFFIFSPPDIDPVENAILLFLWFTIFLLIYEFFATAGMINWRALYPQKFRTNRDRINTTVISIIVGFGFMFFGMVVPPMFIVTGNKSSYLIGAIAIVIISIPLVLLGIHGVRETPEMIEQILKCEEERKKVPFISTMKILLKNRNFRAYLGYNLPFAIVPALAFGSIIYFVVYVLQMDPGYSSFVMISFLVGGIIGIPVWVIIVKKVGIEKVLIYSIVGFAIAMVPILFISDFTSMIVVAGIVSFFVTGIDVADGPIGARVIDEIVSEEGYRSEGVYGGVIVLIIRISTPVAAIVFGLTHFLTGFDPNAATQTPLAQWGIRVHFALIPIIIALLGLFIFLKLWDLKPDKMKMIHAKLKEMDL